MLLHIPCSLKTVFESGDHDYLDDYKPYNAITKYTIWFPAFAEVFLNIPNYDVKDNIYVTLKEVTNDTCCLEIKDKYSPSSQRVIDEFKLKYEAIIIEN